MRLENILHPSRSWRLRRWREHWRRRNVSSGYPDANGRSPQRSPMALTSEEISRVMQQQYGLVIEGTPHKMKGGMESAVWSVRTRDGAWVVKVFQPRRVAVTLVEAEVRLYEYLNRLGFHTPATLQTTGGRKVATLIADGSEFPLLVMRLEKLRKCTPSSISAPELKLIAKTAAQIHERLQDYPDKDQSFDLLSRPPAAEAYEKFAASPLAAELTSAERARLREINGKMVDYVRRNPPNGFLGKSLLHGDFTLEHAQFLPNGEVYLFDFADRWWGPIVYGLAVPLAHFYSEDNISFGRWEELKHWFLEGYTSERKLTLEEEAALNPALIVRLLNEIAYLSEQATDHRDGIKTCDLMRRYDLADYLLHDFDRGFRMRSLNTVHQWLISVVSWLGGVSSYLDS